MNSYDTGPMSKQILHPLLLEQRQVGLDICRVFPWCGSFHRHEPRKSRASMHGARQFCGRAHCVSVRTRFAQDRPVEGGEAAGMGENREGNGGDLEEEVAFYFDCALQ